MKRYQVIIIGSGFGGQCAAINLQEKGVTDFLILERRSFMGGTWCQNTYPGAAVDVQSPLYSLSSEPYNWSQMFAEQEELAQYTNHVIDKHGLRQKTQLSVSVKEVVWNATEKVWNIETGSDERFEARILINATGPLSKPVIPDFKGKDAFRGKSFHTNQWDHSYDYRGKRVAIIGSGASAVQVIPAIAPHVKELHVFQRTPHWVLPRKDYVFKAWQRKLLAYTWAYRLLRWVIYWALETRVLGFKYAGFLLHLIAQRKALKHIKRQVPDPVMRQSVTPDYTIGCKRILLSNTIYPALGRKNVRLHTRHEGIEAIHSNGVTTQQGERVDVDLIVYSTGYDATDGMISYPVIGINGQALSSFWKDYPRAYLGTSVPGFPNLFIVTGPNTGIGHTSAIFVIEAQMRYIMTSIQKMLDQSLKSIEVKNDVENNYTRLIHREMDKTVWKTGGCESWYQSKSGHVVAMFPGFSFTFRRWARNCKKEMHNFR